MKEYKNISLLLGRGASSAIIKPELPSNAAQVPLADLAAAPFAVPFPQLLPGFGSSLPVQLSWCPDAEVEPSTSTCIETSSVLVFRSLIKISTMAQHIKLFQRRPATGCKTSWGRTGLPAPRKLRIWVAEARPAEPAHVGKLWPAALSEFGSPSM